MTITGRAAPGALAGLDGARVMSSDGEAAALDDREGDAERGATLADAEADAAGARDDGPVGATGSAAVPHAPQTRLPATSSAARAATRRDLGDEVATWLVDIRARYLVRASRCRAETGELTLLRQPFTPRVKFVTW